MKNLRAGFAAMALLSATAPAVSAEPFFEGKQITITIGFGPGGGNDLFARVFPDALSEALDGNPSVVVEHMPGAGGVVGLNWYVNAAPRDGTQLFVTSGNLLNRMVLGFDGVDAEVADLTPLVSSPLGRVHYITTGVGVEKPSDLLTLEEPLYLGVTDPLSTAASVVGLKVLEVPYKPVEGYPGKSDALLSLQRGETTVGDMVTPVYLDSVKPLVDDGTVMPLFAQGFPRGNEIAPDPLVPDMPSLKDVYIEMHGEEPSGPGWEAYKTIARSVGNGGKVLMIHQDAPEQAISELKAAFAELLEDEEFVAHAEAALGEYGLRAGEELDETVASIVAMPEESKQWLRDLYTTDYNMSFSN